MYNLIMAIMYEMVIAITISVISNNVDFFKTTKKNTFIFTGILFVVGCFVHYVGAFKSMVPLSTIIIFICFYMFYKNFFYSILISVFTQFIFVLGDAISGFVLIFIFKVDYLQILNNKNMQLITILVILLLSYIISRLASIFLKKLYSSNYIKVKSKNIYILEVYLITALIAIYSYTVIMKSLHQTTSKIISFFNLLFIGSFFIFIILITYQNNKNLKNKLEQQYNEKELSQLKQYTNMIEITSNDLIRFKHDYLNILLTIGEYIESENMSELKAFYKNNLMPESKKILVKDNNFLLLQHIKIIPLKSLLSSKIIEAQTKNIKIKIEISNDINELSIELLDICRILGVLLDNAIEASILCKDKVIEFAIITVNTSVTFIINNSCIETTPPVYQIYEKRFSSKGIGRGIGLESVKNIIKQKYNNVLLNTKIEASLFKQELIILDKK